MRINTTAELATGDIRREIENGQEWLVAPAIPAKEKVYSYDWGKEYLPGDELEGFADEAPVVLDHPVDNTGSPVTAGSPRATNSEFVGQWRNAEVIETDGERKLRGEYWLQLDKRDIHPGYARALDELEDSNQVPVSPGYDPEIDVSSGTFNGERYDAVQRDVSLDHMGLIVTDGATARCGPGEGCAVGRANCCTDGGTHAADAADRDVRANTAFPRAHDALDDRIRANMEFGDEGLASLSLEDKAKVVRKVDGRIPYHPYVRRAVSAVERGEVRQNADELDISPGGYDQHLVEKEKHGSEADDDRYYYANRRVKQKQNRAAAAEESKRQNARRDVSADAVSPGGYDSWRARQDGTESGGEATRANSTGDGDDEIDVSPGGYGNARDSSEAKTATERAAERTGDKW